MDTPPVTLIVDFLIFFIRQEIANVILSNKRAASLYHFRPYDTIRYDTLFNVGFTLSLLS